MDTFIFVQARQGSTRFRNKVLNKTNGTELIKIQYKRLLKVKSKKKIVFLIPKTKNQKLKRFLISNKIKFFEGKENDVLSRYYEAAKKFKAKKIIRLTGDCPLIDHRLLDRLIRFFNSSKFSYVSNIIKRSFPHGMDMEMFNYNTLEKIKKSAKSKFDKEHVTSYITKNRKEFLIGHLLNIKNEKKYRITVDYREDLKLVDKIINYFKPNIYFSTKQIVNYLKKKPHLVKINSKYKIY